jgi:hypothetical protein
LKQPVGAAGAAVVGGGAVVVGGGAVVVGGGAVVVVVVGGATVVVVITFGTVVVTFGTVVVTFGTVVALLVVIVNELTFGLAEQAPSPRVTTTAAATAHPRIMPPPARTGQWEPKDSHRETSALGSSASPNQ